MKKIFCLLYGFVILFSPFTHEEQIRAQPFKEKPFLGIAYKGVSGLEKQTNDKFSSGIEVVAVLYNTAAWETGLKQGDIIVEYDSKKITGNNIQKITNNFLHYIQNKKNIGDEIVLKILRKKTILDCQSDKVDIDCRNKEELINLLEGQAFKEKLDVSIEKQTEKKIFSVILESKSGNHGSPPPDNVDLFPEFEKLTPPYSRLVQQLIHDYNLEDRYSDLMKQYAEDEMTEYGFRLDLVRYIHRDPLKLPVVADIKTASIETYAKNYDLRGLIQASAISLNVDLPNLDRKVFTEPMPDSKNAAQWISYLNKVMEASLKCRNMAFQKLSKNDFNFLARHIPEFVNHFIESNDLAESDNDSLITNNINTISIARNIDYSELMHSAWILAGLSDRVFLDSFFHAIKNMSPENSNIPYGITGEILYSEKTSSGLVIIGGPGPNSYALDAAVIIDTGGDDTYTCRTGAADKDTPISVLIDFKGNDQYSSTNDISMGSGNLGTGILIDMEGDDLYTGMRFSQGSGLLGTGILIDYNGNDQYEGQECCQGVALWGCGILLDYTGNDSYSSALYSQGVGMTKGNGILWDGLGSDTYRALGKHPSSYGTNGIFEGLSQGFGVGFRNYASGGIGMLIDSSGRNKFRAGNYSQGCGYYFGLGILKSSGKEDDIYIGSRYGQGASAHSAAGILIDKGGNDKYTGLKGALQAASWDLSVAALVDNSGDDVYDTAHLFFSQPAAAHNGFSMLIDSSGIDEYNFPVNQESLTTKPIESNNFSFLLDLSGSTDSYNNDRNKNNMTTLQDGNKFIADID
jgi:PDZ domain-containing protein